MQSIVLRVEKMGAVAVSPEGKSDYSKAPPRAGFCFSRLRGVAGRDPVFGDVSI